MAFAHSSGLCTKPWTSHKALAFAQNSGLCIKQWPLHKALTFAQSNGPRTKQWLSHKAMAFAQHNGIRTTQWLSHKAMAFAQSNGIRTTQWPSYKAMAFAQSNGLRTTLDFAQSTGLCTNQWPLHIAMASYKRRGDSCNRSCLHLVDRAADHALCPISGIFPVATRFGERISEPYPASLSLWVPWIRPTSNHLHLNPPLPQPVTFSGRKIHERACEQYIFRSFHISHFFGSFSMTSRHWRG